MGWTVAEGEPAETRAWTDCGRRVSKTGHWLGPDLTPDCRAIFPRMPPLESSLISRASQLALGTDLLETCITRKEEDLSGTEDGVAESCPRREPPSWIPGPMSVRSATDQDGNGPSSSVIGLLVLITIHIVIMLYSS